MADKDVRVPVEDIDGKGTAVGSLGPSSISDDVSKAKEKALLRKLDLKLLPPLTLLYLLSFLDRSNGLYLSMLLAM